MNHRTLTILFLSFFVEVATANAQSHGYTLPSYEEQFGKGIRKVVMIQDDIKRTARIARDGSIVKPFWTLPKPADGAQAIDGSITRRNCETLTDSIFWIRNGEAELTDILFYRDSSFSGLAKTIRGCRKGVLQQTSYNLSTRDTTIWFTVDDTDKYKPKPFFHIYKKYKGGEVYLDYAPDSLLISSFRIVRDGRGMVDTIYEWRRYGAPTGCMGRRDTSEWRQVETHKYKYNHRGGIVEERVYYNDTLGYATRYKLKYYIGFPKCPADNEQFYLQTVSNDYITCKGGYIADYGMLPLKARQLIASMSCDSSEVSKVVCTRNEYHIRRWPKADRKVLRRHWWTVLADSTCLCFDRHGQFQMVERYDDGLGTRWISMIPDKALSHIKQKCGAREKYHILGISASAKGYRIYYWIETPGLIPMGLPPYYLYDKNWNVISHSQPI